MAVRKQYGGTQSVIHANKYINSLSSIGFCLWQNTRIIITPWFRGSKIILNQELICRLQNLPCSPKMGWKHASLFLSMEGAPIQMAYQRLTNAHWKNRDVNTKAEMLEIWLTVALAAGHSLQGTMWWFKAVLGRGLLMTLDSEVKCPQAFTFLHFLIMAKNAQNDQVLEGSWPSEAVRGSAYFWQASQGGMRQLKFILDQGWISN